MIPLEWEAAVWLRNRMGYLYDKSISAIMFVL